MDKACKEDGATRGMPIKPSFGTVVATTVNVPVVNVALPPDSEETPPPREGTIFRFQLSHPKATVFKVNIHALQLATDVQ